MNTQFNFNDDIREKYREIITQYDGGEVFFGCIIDENNSIKDVEALCFGNDESVLAPYEIVKKYNAILHNHPSGNIKPSEPDMSYASYLSQEGIGFFISDNHGAKINTVIPPIVSKKNIKIDLELIKDCFTHNGKISNFINDYEYRDGQFDMSCIVTEALNDDNISIIEAGTGIGKSLAYLIPVFLWVKNNQERIVISTNTINLQSQLVNKDIPIVQNILNFDITPVVVKGRRNYICKLKIYGLQNELEFDENAEELNSILKWINITKEGVIDELNVVPANETLEKITSDADFCLNRHCMFFQSCFFQLARRKASESNVLIVNHHILFADIDIRRQGRGLEENTLLPPYKKIIFDEAHNMIDSASNFFSISFSKLSFYKLLGFLKKKRNKGFLLRLINKLQNTGVKEVIDIGDYIQTKVMGDFDDLHGESSDIFTGITDYFKKIAEDKINENYKEKLDIQYRIKDAQWNDIAFNENIIEQLKKLSELIENLVSSFEITITKFQKLNDRIKEIYELDFKLFKSYQNKINSIKETLDNLINIDTVEYITWIEMFGDKGDPLFRINATPLNIEKILYENLFNVFDSIVCSSATLTVNKKFDYFKRITGLSLAINREIKEVSVDSPFDYQNNVLFIAPVDIPEPAAIEYNEKLNDFLKRSIQTTGGSSFVLFTSYNQLKKSYEEVNPYLDEKGLKCFYQGEIEKSKLLDKFVDNVESSLFATNSFWEGVDAPGRTLRYVILAKLPFSMPNDPIEEARVEVMEKKGIDSFGNYTLPRAVIKFRQGFGRLIRKKDDYGIVAILDSRVLKKYYGKIFLQSLPRCKFMSGKVDEAIEAIKNHIENFE